MIMWLASLKLYDLLVNYSGDMDNTCGGTANYSGNDNGSDNGGL